MTEKRKLKLSYGYVVVAAAFCIMVAVWGTYNTFGVFFKPVLTEFGWTRAMTSGAFSLSWIIQGLLAIVMGRLTDKFGPRLVMVSCGLFLGIGYLLMSQIETIWQFYLVYGVIIGIGMGGAFVPLMSTVARWFIKRRGVMTGTVLAGIGVGTMIIPPVANWLISSYDWRHSYIIVGAIALVFITVAALFLKRDPAQMGLLPDGNRAREETPNLDVSGLSFREAFRTRQFWIICGMFFCFGFFLFTITVHIVPHALELGISATSAASILATIGGVTIAGKIIMGNLADRIGNKTEFIIGFAIVSAVLLWLMAAQGEWTLYLFAIIFALAYSGLASSQSPIVADLSGLSSHGIILGVTNSIGFTTGAALGPILAGGIFDVTGSYSLAFLITSAVATIGLIMTILLRPLAVKEEEDDKRRSS